ncbi:methyltransferase type 11 [Paramagnetospirillum kuznetsovii]|uniref:Methyltransferase type 11 n=1 Tax=Paramagnetospirillum kuznetsovii TaxID=2053833 RepID=A0A364P2K6_9PROT|nr:class I SAM-dependent methyltransferase [Paramagnetospirillum kuznetsovii]RAU23588.1 methyltransferase type 11 [Paramagnetospirillum kuznetsovii]
MSGFGVTWRTTCRHCGGTDLIPYLTLPSLPMTDGFLKSADQPDLFSHPIAVHLCRGCGLSQIRHEVQVAEYYSDYNYSAASSGFASRFMADLAETVWRRYDLKAGDSIIEIGSGDGAQLACFRDLGATVLGFEPSEALCATSRRIGVPVVTGLYQAGSEALIPAPMRPVKAALLTYTFDHLPEPRLFAQSVAPALDPDCGLLILEVHDLEKIFARREFCLFEHEHTIYPTAATLQRILADCGLLVVEIGVLPEERRRGNSLLVVATPKTSRFAPRALAPLPPGPCSDEESCLAFGRSVEDSIRRLGQWTAERRKAGKRLAGYGAGGRGVMTLAAFAKPGDFAYVCDRNTAFHGWFTPGAKVPVVPPEHVFADPVDEILVFSFGYMDEIRADLEAFTAKGGRLTSMLDIL